MQFTTIRGINTPSDSDRAGTNAWISRSTQVTKPAITTMNMAIRILSGTILRMAAMMTLESVRITRTATPMPRPLKNEVVMAMVEHMPSTCTSTGLLVISPSLNCLPKFMNCSSLLSPWRPRRPAPC